MGPGGGGVTVHPLVLIGMRSISQPFFKRLLILHFLYCSIAFALSMLNIIFWGSVRKYVLSPTEMTSIFKSSMPLWSFMNSQTSIWFRPSGKRASPQESASSEFTQLLSLRCSLSEVDCCDLWPLTDNSYGVFGFQEKPRRSTA